ncbi:hypothetical protein GYMLUDRAFT_636243 [Collybiopsis luxurians FD-317 M1]|nr:hypothetical protein GYMLUDRAFT_636243 [Collybiopsis luxurians FD-317 M1]
MVTLHTLLAELFDKCNELDPFTKVWDSHWDRPLDIQNNILRVNSNILDNQADSIVILRGYSTLYEKIKIDQAHRSSASLVFGTPGIGKSTFLPYLLLRLLHDRESVVYYHNGYYIFTSDGVYTPSNGDTSVFLAPEFGRVPALVDADAPLIENSMRKYIKQRGSARFIPTAPSRDEAFAVWSLHHPDKVNKYKRDLDAAWKHYGPDFRLGNEILLSQRNLEDYHWELRNLISSLPMGLLKEFIANPESGKEINDKCIETCSLPGYPNRFMHRLRSRTVLRILYFAIKDLQQRRELYHLFHSTSRLSVSRGYLFEVTADDILSQGFQGMLEPEDGGNREELDLDPITIELFSNTSDANSTTENKFYIPLQGNNATYDAFCYKDGFGIAMQHTISEEHPFSLKGLRDLNKRFKAAGVKTKWFIFVIPKGTQFKYPPLPARRAGWKYFILELDVDQTRAS